MAFNPLYSSPYLPNYTPVYPQQQQNSIVWVNGLNGAKSYLVAPNTTMPLWDIETQTIYLKSVDSSGMPTIKTLKYTTEDEPVKEEAKPVAEVTIQDLNEVYGRIDRLRDELMSKINNKNTAFVKNDRKGDKING